MSVEEKLSAIYQPLFDQLASQIAAQSRVNYSQYDMAIAEITDSKELPQVASGAAKRKLRNMME